MKSYCLLLLLFSCLLGGVCHPLYGQTNLDLLPFETIKIMGCFEVTMLAGEQERIEVQAFDGDADQLKISQHKGVLKIGNIKSVVDEEVEFRIKVYYNNERLSNIYTAGGAEVEFRDRLESEALYVRAGSGSEVFLEVEADRLDLQAAEGAHLTVRGTCRELRAGANTGGILDGHRLNCQDGRLRAGTGGEVSASIAGELDARANTGGIIRYAGDPQLTVNKTVLGGEISKLLQR